MENTQRRRIRDEMFPIVESWQPSGLSKKAFFEERGIVMSEFFYWCKKYREENELGGFVSLTMGGPHAFAQGQSIEIQYPNVVPIVIFNELTLMLKESIQFF